MKIEIYPRTRHLSNYSNLITKETRAFFNKNPFSPRAIVSYHFVLPNKIRYLNKKYRHLDRPTDCLSFPIWDNLNSIPKKGPIILGDIFIAEKVIKEKVSEDNLSKTLKMLILHSLNHLIGKHH